MYILVTTTLDRMVTMLKVRLIMSSLLLTEVMTMRLQRTLSMARPMSSTTTRAPDNQQCEMEDKLEILVQNKHKGLFTNDVGIFWGLDTPWCLCQHIISFWHAQIQIHASN